VIDPREFATVIGCTKCDAHTSAKLLRDDNANVPQPGFVGKNFASKRVALAGQNPAIGPFRFIARDARYTSALRALKTAPTLENFALLNSELAEFIRDWPVHGSYFPLQECGLDLQDIAYFNVVRCRTVGNSQPGTRVISNCLEHFDRWLDILSPRVLVFIGKWAHDRAAHLATRRGIPTTFMNRERSLSTSEREANRRAVVSVVRAAA